MGQDPSCADANKAFSGVDLRVFGLEDDAWQRNDKQNYDRINERHDILMRDQ